MSIRHHVAAAALLIGMNAYAQDHRSNDIRIHQSYARASVPGQTSGGVYLTFQNNARNADALIAATTSAANTVELHTMAMDSNNIMRMREIDAIDIKAGETITMQPGRGYHLMLMGLKAPLKTGDKVPLTLQFKNAGKIETSVSVHDSTGLPAVKATVHH